MKKEGTITPDHQKVIITKKKNHKIKIRTTFRSWTGFLWRGTLWGLVRFIEDFKTGNNMVINSLEPRSYGLKASFYIGRFTVLLRPWFPKFKNSWWGVIEFQNTNTTAPPSVHKSKRRSSFNIKFQNSKDQIERNTHNKRYVFYTENCL